MWYRVLRAERQGPRGEGGGVDTAGSLRQSLMSLRLFQDPLSLFFLDLPEPFVPVLDAREGKTERVAGKESDKG